MGALPPEAKIVTYSDLALALGGSDDSFTGHLLRLIAKADPSNRRRLAAVFPRQVAAWEVWMHIADVGLPGGERHMTAGQLGEVLALVPPPA